MKEMALAYYIILLQERESLQLACCF